jgi:nitrite reductase (NADH) large subunit
VSDTHRIVIVGNGMAGARLAEHIRARKSGRALNVDIFGDEPGGNYNRILLSGVLAGTHAGPDIVLNPVEWYASQDIVLHAGVAVRALDVRSRRVIDQHGAVHDYDTLVLATGSTPVVPRIAGLQMPDGTLIDGAFVFRTVDDCARIAAAASSVTRAVVIGGGLLGVEAARGLIHHGIDVSVVHLGDHVMDAQLDREGGRILRKRLETLGIRVLTGRSTTRVLRRNRVEGLEFDDGARRACDLVVIATGVKPNISLAGASGLRTNRGILVDDDLACPGTNSVFAIGDCVEHRGRVYGLVAPAWEQADVLANRLTGTGRSTVYSGSRLATKLKAAGVTVAVMGDRDEHDEDEVVTYAEPSRGLYGRLVVRDNRLAGGIVIGLGAVTASLVQRFFDAAPLPAQRSELLFPPTGDGPALSVADIPDSARICDCNAVTKETIVETVLGGARSLSAVCGRTRAGTGCGSCRPEVQRIIDFACRRADGPDALAPADGRAEILGGAHAAS